MRSLYLAAPSSHAQLAADVAALLPYPIALPWWKSVLNRAPTSKWRKLSESLSLGVFRSSVTIGLLDPATPSPGMAYELAYARGLGRRVGIVWMYRRPVPQPHEFPFLSDFWEVRSTVAYEDGGQACGNTLFLSQSPLQRAQVLASSVCRILSDIKYLESRSLYTERSQPCTHSE